AAIAIAAAQAGKDIYCQKPLALTIQQGRAMSDAVRRTGVIFQTGSQQRSDARFRFACELVRNGRIGRVHTVEVQLPGSMTSGPYKPTPIPAGFDYDLWLGPAPYAPYHPMRVDAFGWRWNFDYAGGCITDWGAHHIDIAQWGLGTTHTGPVEFEGTGIFSTDDLSDTAITWDCHCTYANGVKMRIWADEPFSLAKEVPNGIRFIGTDGWIFVNRGTIDAHPKSILSTPIAPNELHLYPSNHHYGNFLDCIKTRHEPAAPVEQAHRSISIAHLCNIAMRTARKIRWNPDTEQILSDPAASRFLSRSMREPWHL
ncbi:MAG: Gfo/Idh/MocA family protein, partial [Bacillota bacterium]